jgi:hypothetical protein
LIRNLAFAPSSKQGYDDHRRIMLELGYLYSGEPAPVSGVFKGRHTCGRNCCYAVERLRSSMGAIDAVAVNDARRLQFNSLHNWSTRLEGTVLLLGLLTLFLVAGEATAPRRRL